jgi:hypothetical protein
MMIAGEQTGKLLLRQERVFDADQDECYRQWKNRNTGITSQPSTNSPTTITNCGQFVHISIVNFSSAMSTRMEIIPQFKEEKYDVAVYSVPPPSKSSGRSTHSWT